MHTGPFLSPRTVVATALIVGAAACGIDVVGGAADAPAPTATPRTGDASLPEGAAAPADGGADAAFDAGDAGCLPTTTTDAFTTIDGTKWLTVSTDNNGFPQVNTSAPGGGTAVQLVDARDYAKGGLWLKTKLAAKAFDITLSVQVKCGAQCGDGFAIGWVDAPAESALTNSDNGRTVGLPKNVKGGAAQLDYFQNDELGDGPAPAIRILELKSDQTLGNYKWVLKSGPKTDNLVNGTHALAVRLRAGTVHVSVDGAEVTSAAVPAVPYAYFGVTAANGGYNAAVYVKDFVAKTYDCEPSP